MATIGKPKMDTISIFWISILVLLFSIAGYVFYSAKNFITLVIAFLIALLFPSLLVKYDCLVNSTSEACVWGKSLLNLYTMASIIGVFPILFLLLSFCTYIYRKVT